MEQQGQPRQQRAIELILARNLLSSVSTPALLAAVGGEMIFYNDAAASLLGKRFEEVGRQPAEVWTREFGPFAEDGVPIPFEQLGVSEVLRSNRPAQGTFTIRAAKGDEHQVQVSAFPLVGPTGYQGAIVFFWPQEESDQG
jgi:PAS domain-containing protein